VAFASTLTAEQRAALLASANTISRTVFTNVGLPSLTPEQRAALMASTITITRTIKGVVDAGSLTTQQSALLSAITGATAGKLTLGGTFTFDPSTGFKTWYESQTKSAITTPMDQAKTAMWSLREQLVALKNGIAAEGERQERAAADALKIANAQNNLAALAAQKNAAVTTLGNKIDAVKEFDAATGGNLSYKGGNAQMGIGGDGRLIYNVDSVMGASQSDLAQWNAKFWGAGNLQSQLLAADNAVGAVDKQLEAARQAIRAMGGVPSFAGGGYTGDGARSGGLDGMGGFGAILHPQETVVDQSGGVFDTIVVEIVKLRKEVEDFKSQSRQIDQASFDQQRKTVNTLRKWDAEGLPPERTPA
jgi:hypothetical protein